MRRSRVYFVLLANSFKLKKEHEEEWRAAFIVFPFLHYRTIKLCTLRPHTKAHTFTRHGWTKNKEQKINRRFVYCAARCWRYYVNINRFPPFNPFISILRFLCSNSRITLSFVIVWRLGVSNEPANRTPHRFALCRVACRMESVNPSTMQNHTRKSLEPRQKRHEPRQKLAQPNFLLCSRPPPFCRAVAVASQSILTASFFNLKISNPLCKFLVAQLTFPIQFVVFFLFMYLLCFGFGVGS